jgi:flagellar motor switch/type III secretory pathway protein FliN
MSKDELVSQLRVTMSAALCRLKVPAAVLGSLGENDCIEVAQPPDVAPEVELKVNGKLFARATLFEHEGSRFVRITELVSQPVQGGFQKWCLVKNQD